MKGLQNTGNKQADFILTKGKIHKSIITIGYFNSLSVTDKTKKSQTTADLSTIHQL